MVSAWPMKTAEYDWDLIDAEHHAAVTTTGATISRQHGLIFLVRKSATDSTLVDSFAIGNSMQMGEVTVPAVWEHIRRFMEEGGPHFPPGDVLRPSIDPIPSGSAWRPLDHTALNSESGGVNKRH